MANYSKASLELLEEVEALDHELQGVYRAQALGNPGNHAQRIGKLHHRINLCLKRSEILATHGLRQAIEDARVPA